MDLEYVLFLIISVLTHGIGGYALVRAFTDVNPTVGFLLGILPNVDFLFPAAWGTPFIHRGNNTYASLSHRDRRCSWPVAVARATQTGEEISRVCRRS